MIPDIKIFRLIKLKWNSPSQTLMTNKKKIIAFKDQGASEPHVKAKGQHLI